jgi:hypothetical protein
LEPLQRRADLLLGLPLLSHQADQACKYISPLARTVGQHGFFSLKPLVQYRELPLMMKEQQQQRNTHACQGYDSVKRYPEQPGNHRNQKEEKEAIPETGHVVIWRSRQGSIMTLFHIVAVGAEDKR